MFVLLSTVFDPGGGVPFPPGFGPNVGLYGPLPDVEGLFGPKSCGTIVPPTGGVFTPLLDCTPPTFPRRSGGVYANNIALSAELEGSC